MSTVSFEKFNRTFFKDSIYTIEWFEKKGIIRLKNGLIATILIDTKGVHNQYQRYVVTIISKDSKLDTHFFDFDTYLGKGVEVIDYCCEKEAKFCGIQPTIANIIRMVCKIDIYIQMFEIGLSA
jgi:hypothetical protein